MSDNAFTVLVCGFDRCGSSLMMQMLLAGGIPVTGEPPLFQDDRASGIGGPLDLTWLPQVRGHAVKVLYPNLQTIPAGAYQAIWLDRDYGEQAKSNVKFMRAVGGAAVDPGMAARIAEYNRESRGAARDALIAAGAAIFDVQFEHLFSSEERPGLVSRLAAFIGRNVDEAAMLAAINPRDPQCAPGMEPGAVDYVWRVARAARGVGDARLLALGRRLSNKELKGLSNA